MPFQKSLSKISSLPRPFPRHGLILAIRIVVGCSTILIIEDDDSIRETLKLALELEGYDVKTAENGREGLKILLEMPKPCLILLDLMMPVMNGWDFAAALDEEIFLPPIPIVVVTAFGDKAKTLNQASSVIKKPVDLELLFKTVSHYCQVRILL